MGEKRYYWLKLKEGFFRQIAIKKLRKISGGDTLTIIYQKLLLLSLQNGGEIYYHGMEETFSEELALEIDEEPDDVELALLYIQKIGLSEIGEDGTMYMTAFSEMVGSETASAERQRISRAKRKALEGKNCDNVTQICDNVTPTSQYVTPASQMCHTDIDIDKDIEIDKEIDKEIEIEIETDKDKKHMSTKGARPTSKQILNEFEEIWSIYPRKIGKAKALQAYQKARREGVTFEEIQIGLEAYGDYCRRNKVEMEYVKHGSTWFNQRGWEDDYSLVTKKGNLDAIADWLRQEGNQ